MISTPPSPSSRTAATRSTSYERFAKIKQQKDGSWRIANGRVAQTYRMNVGTIVEADNAESAAGARPREERARPIPARCGAAAACSARSRNIFSRQLAPGDTFLFGGEILPCARHRRRRGARLPRQRRSAENPFLRSAASFHSRRISRRGCADMVANPETMARTARAGRRMARASRRSARCCRRPAICWSRHFRAAAAFTSSAYPFEGRLAHQTLGMLLTRRMERAGAEAARLRRQ